MAAQLAGADAAAAKAPDAQRAYADRLASEAKRLPRGAKEGQDDKGRPTRAKGGQQDVKGTPNEAKGGWDEDTPRRAVFWSARLPSI